MLRIRGMPRRPFQVTAISRASMLACHVSSGNRAVSEGPRVLFNSDLAARTYILNRPDKINALDHDMIKLLRARIQEWDEAQLCKVIVGTGNGRGFCSGGDIVAVMEHAKKESSREKALAFFKDEFELNFMLGNLSTPYVAIMDGITMGGGAGLSMHAPFRVATENTIFAMPETLIGYIPDVGGNYFLSRLDGEIGTYLCLTGAKLKGRAVFEHGIATHYIPARRVQTLRTNLSSLEQATPGLVDATIEELYYEPGEEEPPPPFVDGIRVALDLAFSKGTVEEIVSTLETLAKDEGEVGAWAQEAVFLLSQRSPTSLKVALQAIRRGKAMTLGEVLQMEMGLATAFIHDATPDFVTGITALRDKIKSRPQWTPETPAEVSDARIIKDFFSRNSLFRAHEPQLSLPSGRSVPWGNYALPSENEIGRMVQGSHHASGGTGLTLDELVKRFVWLRNCKHGLTAKVLEVVRRRCRISENPEREGYLEWIH